MWLRGLIDAYLLLTHKNCQYWRKYLQGQRLLTALMVPCPGGGMPRRGDGETGGGTGRSLPGASSTRHHPPTGDGTAHTSTEAPLCPGQPPTSCHRPLGTATNVTMPPAAPAWAQPLRSAHQPWHRCGASRAQPTPAWRADGSGSVRQRRVPGGGCAPSARGTSCHQALLVAGTEQGHHPCHFSLLP